VAAEKATCRLLVVEHAAEAGLVRLRFLDSPAERMAAVRTSRSGSLRASDDHLVGAGAGAEGADGGEGLDAAIGVLGVGRGSSEDGPGGVDVFGDGWTGGSAGGVGATSASSSGAAVDCCGGFGGLAREGGLAEE